MCTSHREGLARGRPRKVEDNDLQAARLGLALGRLGLRGVGRRLGEFYRRGEAMVGLLSKPRSGWPASTFKKRARQS